MSDKILMEDIEKKQKAIKEFEEIKDKAEMRALSKISLKRVLTNKEFERYKELGKKYLLN